MLHSEGQKLCPHCHVDQSKEVEVLVHKTSRMLSSAQIKLLEYADHLDGPDRVKHLKLLHDVALYHSHGSIDEDEKNALFSAKCLWECIEKIIGEGKK